MEHKRNLISAYMKYNMDILPMEQIIEAEFEEVDNEKGQDTEITLCLQSRKINNDLPSSKCSILKKRNDENIRKLKNEVQEVPRKLKKYDETPWKSEEFGVEKIFIKEFETCKIENEKFNENENINIFRETQFSEEKVQRTEDNNLKREVLSSENNVKTFKPIKTKGSLKGMSII